MHEALFNPAIWMPAVLAAIGIAIFIYGNARVQTAVRNVGAGVLALTLAWCVVAYFVRTPLEECVDRTHAIVAAVETQRWDDLRTLLDRNTSLLMLRGGDQIAKVAQDNAERFSISQIRILNTNPQRGVDTIDVTINTFVEGRYNTTAVWKFEYEQRADGMLLSRVTPLSVGGASMDQIRSGVGN